KFIRFLPRTIIHILIPLIIVSFLTCYFMVKKTLRPVMKMMESARKISSENFDELLPVSRRNDELDQLAATFNDLFSRLKFDFERERSFTSDVSHELKTPVAIILGEAKLLKRWGKDDPEQLEESLNTILEEGKSMNEIIKNLLQMARLENGQIELKKDKIFINNMFVRIENEYKAVSPDVKFESYVEKEFLDSFIETDGELLHQVLAVAVSNSIKFVGQNCVIKLSCKRNANSIVLAVEDNGPGFDEKVLPHVFERFYRGDSAHNRNAGGAGLGLSIATVIMNALGGEILAKNAEKQGAVIELILK
ncbi:MAG: HAMP domain-containing histidine kinase, partial [Treponema sp.]|nr:HAMP domain-containing histidine kinase [Treponema sp.]